MKQLFGLFALCVAGLACAASPATVSGAWIRLLPGELPAAGYFTVHNDSDQPLQLVGAESPAFGAVMLHQSVEDHGSASMRMVAAVTVPAHGEIRFEPSGYHLMLMQRQQPLKVGETVPIVLQLKGGAVLKAMFQIKGASATGP